MKRLRNKEIRAIKLKLQTDFPKLPDFIGKKVVELNGDRWIVEDEVIAFQYKDKIIPSIRVIIKHDCMPKVVVDDGAVRHVVSGADIFRPGIVTCSEEIKKNSPVTIVEETHKKPLAIGIALFDAQEIMGCKNGVVVKNIHHVGDEIWKHQ